MSFLYDVREMKCPCPTTRAHSMSVVMQQSSRRGGVDTICRRNRRRLPGGGVEAGRQLCSLVAQGLWAYALPLRSVSPSVIRNSINIAVQQEVSPAGAWHLVDAQ